MGAAVRHDQPEQRLGVDLEVLHGDEEAVEAAKELVWENLCSMHRRGMTPEQLFEAYRGFGEDPFVVAVPPAELVLPVFSARAYAQERCPEACGPIKAGVSTRPWWQFWRAAQ